jgi:PAS domain S-box-containing protein
MGQEGCPAHEAPVSQVTISQCQNDARVAELEQELARLRKRDEELTDFVENATIGLHWVGPDGMTLWANQAELDLLGYEPAEYIGRHIAEFHADAPVIEDILRRLQARETLRNYEARMRAKDGTIRHVVINSNVLWDGDRFVHTRCFTRDITDRRRAEEALKKASDSLSVLADEARKREELLRFALCNSPVVVFHQNVELRYTFVCNPFAEHQSIPLTNKLDSELFPPKEAEQLDRLKRGVLSSGKGARQEVGLTTAGQLRIMDIRIEPFLDDSGVIAGVVGTAVDITERKRNEQRLSRSLEQLRQLAARLQALQEKERAITSREVHDIGQVMTALEFQFAAMIGRKSEGTDPNVMTKHLKAVSRLLASTIESSARISEHLRPSLLDNLGLARTLDSHAQEFARRTGIHVTPETLEETCLDPDVSVAVYRIFEEALISVQHHARVTEVHFGLRREGDSLILRIRDNGTGVSPEKISDAQSLGLLAMRERALLFGARIDIDSMPGMGTTVSLTIPLDARMLVSAWAGDDLTA